MYADGEETACDLASRTPNSIVYSRVDVCGKFLNLVEVALQNQVGTFTRVSDGSSDPLEALRPAEPSTPGGEFIEIDPILAPGLNTPPMVAAVIALVSQKNPDPCCTVFLELLLLLSSDAHIRKEIEQNLQLIELDPGIYLRNAVVIDQILTQPA